MKSSVIICGLVRDEQRLIDKISQFLEWQDKNYIDQIVYSTWIGELDRYKHLREFLKCHQIDLVVSQEPLLILKGGHQLHQMQAFYYGMECIKNKDQFILKTRVDLADNCDAMLDVFSTGTDLVSNNFLKLNLKYKILVENAQLYCPFLCGDAQFYGHYLDLEKLITMSNEYEILYNRIAVEQTFFFNPFKSIKLFKTHFYWNLPHISEFSKDRLLQLKAIKNSFYLTQAINAWLVILSDHFHVGWDIGSTVHNQVEFRDCNLLSLGLIDNFSKFIGADKSDVICHNDFIKALSPYLEKIRPSVYKSITDHTHSLFDLPLDLIDDYELFRNSFSDLNSPKIPIYSSSRNMYTIPEGAAPHFFVKNKSDHASSRYHEQVTSLRRENDLLKKHLKVSYSHTSFHQKINKIIPRVLISKIKSQLPLIASLYKRFFMHKIR